MTAEQEDVVACRVYDILNPDWKRTINVSKQACIEIVRAVVGALQADLPPHQQ